MKKIYLAFLTLMAAVPAMAQTNLVIEAPLHNNSQSNVRAPNGTSAHAYYSACFLVKQNELFNLPSGTNITSFGYTMNTGVTGSTPTGNYTLYLQNTTDATYQKGTTFATALGGMTTVYASVLSLPVSVGTTSVMVTLSTPFNYSGGGLYVAYNWTNSGPYASVGALYLGETTALPLPGGAGGVAFSALSAQSTLTLTNSRPSFLIGFTNANSNDMEVAGILAPGKVPAMLNSPHQVTALVKNISNTSLNNVPVTLNVGGANVFTDTQTLTTIGAGATALVMFSQFNPGNAGVNTLSVSVNSDQNNLNNMMTYTQQVTCNEWSLNPPQGSYTINQVGFATGAGILSTAFANPASSTLSAIRMAIATNTNSVGKPVYGVLQSNTGAIIATTNTITITTAMLGTFITFTFSNPQSLAPATTYYFGMAQTASSAPGYHPFGTLGSWYLPNYYTYTGITGGSFVVLTQNFGYFGIEAVFLPNITLTVSPQSLSCGNSATVNAFSSTNYSWSTGATTSSIVVSPTVSTGYTVVASNTLGCSVSTVVMVNVTPLSLTIAPVSTTICLGDQVTISASGATTWSWSTGSNAGSIVETPSVTTTFSVIGDNLGGCVNTATAKVTVQSFSTLAVAPVSTTICVGATVSFTGSSASSYTWDTGSATLNTNTISTTPSVSSVYTLTGANPLGCTMSRTVDITVNSTSLITTPDTTICKGDTITLTASGANSYVWNQTYSFSALPVTPTVTTIYQVSGIGLNNCTGTATVTVSVNDNPTVTVAASRTLMCKNEKNTVTAGGALTYLWSHSTSSTPSIVITPTNTIQQNIKVTGTDVNGCKSSATIKITISNCTGLEEIPGEGGVVIFPNPSKGTLQLRSSGLIEAGEVAVFNLLGDCIYKGEMVNGAHTVDLQAQPKGIYLVQLSDAGGTIASKRIIIQ